MAGMFLRKIRIVKLLFGFALVPHFAAAQAPFDVRGKTVEAHRQAMQTRIAALRAAILDTLKAAAPDLVPRLDPAAPPVPQGYQLLPRIVPDLPQPPETGHRASLYSWPWTDTLIMRGDVRLDSLDGSVVRPNKQRADYDRLVTEFNGILADRRIIDAHVEHNWFWQRAIAADTGRFGTSSRMIERQLSGSGPASVAPPNMPVVRMTLVDSSKRPVIVRVPIVTDIEDTTFVRAVQAIIEGVWKREIDGQVHQLRLDVQFVTPRSLYCPAPSPPSCAPPARGAVIDLQRHVARFESNIGILTTGGTTPHVLGGRAMILGPRDVTSRTLGHEFGHVLGFDDAYLRGYRALGDDGYAIIELIPDRGDIMAASGISVAQPRHFEQLEANLRADRAMQAGLTALYQKQNARGAVALFREVLANRPGHYGATFQLAKALDLSGDTASATPIWRGMLDLARAQRDSATLATVRSRLGIPR